MINSMIYPVPVVEHGFLGIHITPTIEGNILLGPSSEYIDNLNDKKTTNEKMNKIFSEAKEIIPFLSKKAVINAYAGIRCKLTPPGSYKTADYIIEESKNNPGLINLVGIESPGLTAAPAIAEEVLNIVSKSIELKQKNYFKSCSNKRRRFSEMSTEEQSALIKKDNRWGRIVCRCEHITEAEVIKALSNPLEAQTISSVKFRCRAGMGRCQGGFCTQHIVRIMEKNYNIDIKNMKLKSPDSNLFYRRVREEKDDRKNS
jgi:glycerol-3-phosphate dehydrogenase